MTSLIVLIAGVAILRPGHAATTLAEPPQAGLALMNVQSQKPADLMATPVKPDVSRPVVAEILADETDAQPVMMFDGRPLRRVKQITMLTTAYSPDEKSCGKWADGMTASGYSVWTNGMKLVAADTQVLPFGTLVSIPGYNGGRPVPVLDRGGKIKGHRLDLLYPTHEIALQWGAQRLVVDVWEYAD